MSAPSNNNFGYPDRHITNETPLSHTMGSSTPRSASILNNASNNHISNNVFTTNNTNTTNISAPESPLAGLYNSVAPNAILNAGGRADEVRCYPGTREEVIGVVENSIAQKFTGPRMLWLSGPAGAGKSAIMQTVAERCKEEDVPHANFFFFRADGSRKNLRSFVPTIMYQIMRRYPSVKPAVEAALRSDPLVFNMAIHDQFEVLLQQAVGTIHDTSPSLPPLVLLIDGLDECDSENKKEQRQLLHALDTLLTKKGPNFRVVVASRVEPQISMAFRQLRSEFDSIFLDEKYSPKNDIDRFVTAEFNKIKSSHYLAATLGPEWPSESNIASIVSKSSGQFIFAATVMSFIAHSPASPTLSLQRVLRIIPSNKNSPFAQLDAVYSYILEQVEDWEAVKVMLSMRLLDSQLNPLIPNTMRAYQPRFSREVFNSCLSELASLVHMRSSTLEFFHASFTDFLQDNTRSGEYHINLETFCMEVVPFWWRNRSSVLALALEVALERVQRPTQEMTAAFMECIPNIDNVISDVALVGNRLNTIYVHDRETFIKIIRTWISRSPKLATDLPRELRQYAIPASESCSSVSPSAIPESRSSVSPSAPPIRPSSANRRRRLIDHWKSQSTSKS